MDWMTWSRWDWAQWGWAHPSTLLIGAALILAAFLINKRIGH